MDDMRIQCFTISRLKLMFHDISLTYHQTMCCKENSTFHLLLSLVSLFITITQISAVHFPINVWPKPTTFHWPHPASILLSPSFTISHPNHQHLSSAVSRYHHQILNDHHHPLVPPSINLSSSPPLSSLIITISDLTSPLIHNVNESYTLTIPPQLDSNTELLTTQTPRVATRVKKPYLLNIPSPLNSAQTPRRATCDNTSYTLNIPSSVVNRPSNNRKSVQSSTRLTTPPPLNFATAYLTAQTPWGAMRGLETFSQLVYGNPPRVAAGVYISDEPIFRYRGVLLDTSRNYYGVEDLLRLIKAMSMNKLNVFHWHITDSHSFPLVLACEPELAERGSYGEDMRYTIHDVKKIVEFGLDHGVRVVPEIDMPAHTGSWAEAYPEIVTCANMFWYPAGADWSDRLASEPGTGQLNPLNAKTYQVVKNVIRDVVSIFPDPFFHAGADEVVPKCWETDPSIQSFLANSGSLSKILEIFVNATLPYIVSLNRTVVYWEDVLLDAEIKVDASILPHENVILQTWNNGPSNTKRIVGLGYQVIVSSSEYYYLDCGHGGFLGNDTQYDLLPGADQGNGGSWCAPFKTWQTIYNYDITYGLTTEEAKLVLGGEVALWSEQADPSVLDSRMWPRASAMAESLWSGNRDDNGVKRCAEATNRLNEWRYRMVRRGIGAEPIQPLWCVRNPGMCNSVNPFEV